MAEIGSLAVSLSLDASNFNGSIAQVNRQMTAMGSELRALSAKGDTYGKSVEGLGQKQNILSRQFDAAGVKLQEQRRRYDELVASGTASEAAIERQANAVNRAQADYNRLERELAEVTEQLRVQSSQWTQAGQRMQEVGGKLKSVGDGMKTVGKSLSMYVSAPLIAAATGAFKMAVDFESAFAGVRKTVDTSEEGFKKLEQGIRDMAKELPASASDIAAVAESAGQLGIAEDKILSFSRTIIDLGESTNLTREQAATEFARFANIVGMSQDNFDRLGSSVVGLGNTMATTEAEIVSMGMRLAAQGAQVGMSEAQIMALAGTMSSLGIQAEMGGTAMTTILKKIQKAVGAGGNDLAGFAKAAGMTGSEFKKAFENDAVTALDALVKGLAKSADGGSNLTTILADLGIKGVYESDVLLRMAGASDLLSRAVNTSTNAWKENTALSNEASQRYETTASQMAMLKNQIVDVGISIGNILIPMARDAMDTIGPWVEKFSNLSEETKKTILVLGGLAAAVGPVLIVGGALISSVGTITTTIGAAATAIGAAGGVTAVLGGAFAALTGPVGLTVLGIAAVGTAAVVVGKEMSEASLQVEGFGDKVSESTAKAVGSFLELSNQATVATNEMAWSGVAVTTEMASSITTIYQEMGQQVLTEMQNANAAEVETMTQHFANTTSLSQAEEQAILTRLQTHNSEREAATKAGTDRVTEIYNTAAQENRTITEAEQREVNMIHETMKNNAIQYMTESEAEQKVILENLKNESSKITADMAAEVVRNSVKKKDEVIKEANEEYDGVVEWAVRQRDETGVMSAEEAQKVIDDARHKRDETISSAEEMHEKVVGEAKKQAEEHVNKVDWETGEVKSKFKVMTEDLNNDMKKAGKWISDEWDKAWKATKKFTEDTKKNVADGFKTMGTEINGLMQSAGKFISTEWDKAMKTFDVKKMISVGKDVVDGLIKGIGEKFSGVQKKIEELASKIPQWAKDILGIKSPSRVFMAIGRDTVEGMEVGMAERESNLKAVMENLTKGLTDATKKAFDESNKVIEKSNADIAKIEKRLGEDIDKIRRTAAANNRKTTQDENIKMQRLQEDAAKKIADIEAKTAKSSTAALTKAHKERFNKIKLFVDDKKSLEQLSLADEAEIWKLATEQFAAGTKERVEAQKNYKKAIEAINKEDLESIKQYIADKKSLEELSLTEEAAIWERTTTLFEEGTKERIEAQKSYQTAVQAINKELTATNKEYSDQIIKINEDLIKSEEALNKAYEDAVSKRESSLVNFKGTFDEFRVEIDKTGEELMANLQSQVSGFEEWQRQIDLISNKAIDKGLLDELRQMGPNALPQLMALNSMTDKQLSEYSDLYAKKSKLAREQAEKEMKGMKDDTEKQIKKMRNLANAELDDLRYEWGDKIKAITKATGQEFSTLEQVGRDAGQGLLNGLSSMEGSLQAKAQSIANSIKNAIQSALDIHSPSRVMRGFGVNIGQGLVLGMDDMVDKVSGAAQRLASSVEGSIGFGGTTPSNVNNSRSYNGQTTIHVYSNNPSPSEIARRNTQAQRQQAMEWGMA